MFNSKSVLSVFDLKRLRFECDQIALWCEANARTTSGRWSDPHVECVWPDLKLLPVTKLGEGNYGAAYRLTNWPGLVLKLCRCPDDGYPLYIKGVANAAKRKRWMPVVFAYGGDDTMQGKMFWCVLPEYTNPVGVGESGTYECRAWKESGGAHIEKLVSLSTRIGHRAVPAGMDWKATKAAEDAHYEATGMMAWRSNKDFTVMAPERGAKVLALMAKPERRMYRQMREFFRSINVDRTYCHAGNAMLDGEQWILTDPVPGVDVDTKVKTYAHRNW